MDPSVEWAGVGVRISLEKNPPLQCLLIRGKYSCPVRGQEGRAGRAGSLGSQGPQGPVAARPAKRWVLERRVHASGSSNREAEGKCLRDARVHAVTGHVKKTGRK